MTSSFFKVQLSKTDIIEIYFNMLQLRPKIFAPKVVNRSKSRSKSNIALKKVVNKKKLHGMF